MISQEKKYFFFFLKKSLTTADFHGGGRGDSCRKSRSMSINLCKKNPYFLVRCELSGCFDFYILTFKLASHTELFGIFVAFKATGERLRTPTILAEVTGAGRMRDHIFHAQKLTDFFVAVNRFFFDFFFEKTLDKSPTFMVRVPPTPHAKVAPTRRLARIMLKPCTSTRLLRLIFNEFVIVFF